MNLIPTALWIILWAIVTIANTKSDGKCDGICNKCVYQGNCPQEDVKNG